MTLLTTYENLFHALIRFFGKTDSSQHVTYPTYVNQGCFMFYIFRDKFSDLFFKDFSVFQLQRAFLKSGYQTCFYRHKKLKWYFWELYIDYNWKSFDTREGRL